MTGPGAAMNKTRANVNTMTENQLLDKDFQQQALIPIGWATHAGDDVAVYANGPFSYLFHSTVDNTYISQAMKYALCVPPYDKEPFCAACALKISVAMLIALVAALLMN